jgi:glycosyltransferase involved in cell wall biosynthesis
MGGAEKALINRMKYVPNEFEHTVLNVRPEIDVLELNPTIREHRVSRRGILRIINIYKFLLQNSFDIVIVRTPVDAIRFGLLRTLCPQHVPRLVFEAHNNFVTKRFGMRILLHKLLQLSFRMLDLIVAVSQNVSNGPQCQGHKNIHTIYLGAELNELPLLQRTPNAARLIYVGRLVDFKRPVWLLERLLAVRIRQPLSNCVLTIVGSGPLENELRDFVSRYDLEDFVCIAGRQINITPYLISATHLVSSSTNEGLPLAFFEAKLAGLAILATPSGGGAEIFDVEDQELESQSEEAFEAALEKILITPPPSLEERRQIQEKSSWMSAEQCAKDYYLVLSQLLSTEQ